MSRSLSAVLVVTLLASISFAFAAEPTKPVEVIRGPKRTAAKKSPVVNDVEQQAASNSAAKKANELTEKEDALNAREADLRARESAVDQRESDSAKRTEEEQKRAETEKKAKAKRQKAAEDLAKKVHSEFGAAADALGGE